jgi:hypothetical protein
VKHLGIVAHSAEGAALCFRTFCQEGFARLGAHDHPDVTLDSIALARAECSSCPVDDGAERLAWDESGGATTTFQASARSARGSPRAWRVAHRRSW